MKFSIFIAALIVLTFAYSQATAQKTQPRSVEDFYMILPAKYLQPLAKVKNRKTLIEEKDLGNGYLRLAGGEAFPDWEGWGEVALFKKSNGDYIVGVVDGDCATYCTSGVKFLEYKAGKWADVTAQIFPKTSNAAALARYKTLFPNDTEYTAQNPPMTNYALPRKGTTVVMNANDAGADDTVLFRFVWDGTKFSMKN